MAWLKGSEVSGYVEIDRPVRFKQSVLIDEDNPIGDTFYVRNNGSDSANGKSPGKAFKTLEYAVHHAAGDWDKIIFLPSTDLSAYLVEAVSGVDDGNIPIVITQKGLKILGGQTSQHCWGSPALHTHTTSTLIQINAHGVEIAGMAFHDQGAGCSIEAAVTDNYWRTHIHDCYFGGNSSALWAIVLGNYTGSGVGEGHTVDAPTSVIERCTFSEYVTGDIFFNGGFSIIDNCMFVVPANSQAIRTDQHTSSRGSCKILNSKFAAISASTSTGINVAATPDQGQLFIDGNHFVGFGTDALCCTKRTGYMGLNYAGVTVVTITTG